MTVFDAHANFIKTLVATAPSPATSGTSLAVTTGDVSALAIPTTGSFNAVIFPTGTQPTATNAEIVRCTWTSGDTFTIARHQEGSITRTIVIGDQFILSDTAKIFKDIEDAINTISNSTLPGDGGTPSTTYGGAAKIDLGGPS